MWAKLPFKIYHSVNENHSHLREIRKTLCSKPALAGFVLSKFSFVELTNINTSMKYNTWYNAITERAKARHLTEYTETHHIVPQSLGGSGDSSNLVELTPREHFICHWLLVKMTTGEAHWKMLNALRMMRAENPRQKRYKTKITARVYAKLKQEYSLLQSERHKGEGNGFYGKTHTDEAKKRISEANKGRVPPQHEIDKMKQSLAKRKELGLKRKGYSEEYKEGRSKKYSGEGNPRFGAVLSEETKKKMSLKAVGRKQSDETIKKKADAIRGSKREKKHCPHCNQLVAVNGYARWHGDNCKKLKAG